MADIRLFPGTTEIREPLAEPVVDLKDIAEWQELLLWQWKEFGAEVRRRVPELPPDLRYELCELLRASADING